MPFDLRCPSCDAKLWFDAVPPRGEEVVCAKCDAAFPAPPEGRFTPTAPKAAKPDPKPAADKKPRAYVTKERVHFNPLVLLAIVGGLMLALILGLFVPWVVFIASAAQTQSIVAAVPENYNVIRGVNVKGMRNVPGVKREQDKYLPDAAAALFSEVADKLDINKDTQLLYYVVAREAGTTAPPLHFFLIKKPFDRAKLGSGQSVPLAGGTARALSRQLVVVAAGGGGGGVEAILNASATNYANPPKNDMNALLGETGRLATRGQVWAVTRDAGTLKGYLAGSVAVIKEDSSLSDLSKGMEKATVLATWTSFGGAGVRFGASLEMPSKEDAKDLVTAMKKGPLGKGDESEPPNKFKAALPYVDPKLNGEFLQYLEYKSSGPAAYVVTKIESPEKARQALDGFNNPNRATGATR